MRHLIEDVKAFLNEGKSDYEIYHKTYTSAVQEVIRFVEKNGYKVDEDDRFRIVGTGTRRPSEGKTTAFELPLYRQDGNPAMTKIVVQVYGMRTQFELNMYFGKAALGMY
jgi:hypothetical protein